jgi:hypothetical protein
VLGERYRCSKCNRFFTFGAASDIDSDTGSGGGGGTEPCDAMGSDHYPDITLRDNDLKKRLKLDFETASKLLKQLTRDSNFLASMGIMDYSLLVGTHYSHFRIVAKKKTTKPTAPTVARPASSPELEREVPVAGVPTAASGVAHAGATPDKEFVHILVEQPGGGYDEAGKDEEAEEVSEALRSTSERH